MERLACVVSLIFGLVNTATASQNLKVCASCGITRLGDAIAQARSGDTIRLMPGVYPETGLIVDKPLSIEGVSDGASAAVIDGKGVGTILRIHANHVRISGITIQNSGFSYMDDLSAIEVEDSGDVTISKNVFLNNFFSIHVEHSHDCLIENNQIQGADRGESAAGNGIHVWYGENMVIQGNAIRGQRDGIYFEFVKKSHILNNRSEGNLRYGLHFMFSNDDEYDSNVFTRNASGVAVMYSKNMKMSHNHFEKSWGGSAYGILLKEMTTSTITANTFQGNTVGVYMEGTDRSKIEGNDFIDNGWAVRVLADNDANTFTHNNFVGNTFDASTNSSSSRNTFDQNYWSSYVGLDLNGDGMGDTPYRPVKLSSVLMERFGTSVLLLKSFFFTVADEAESAMPVLTPDAFKDDHPLMKRFETAR